MTEILNRADLVRRCRDLERAYIRLQAESGMSQAIPIQWSRQWAMALLDTRCPTAKYESWITSQENECVRQVQKLVRMQIEKVSA